VRQSRDTANRLFGIAKAVLNKAFNEGLVPDDRAWRRIKAFRGVGEARMVLLSETDIQALVNHMRPDLRDMIMLAAWTGCRWGEVRSLRVRDFDRNTGRITVSGKTGRRTIYLPPAAITTMHALTEGKKPADHVFLTATGAPWARTWHTKPFARAVRAAGIDPRAVPYSLRHTWISRALAAGVPVKDVADHAGTSIQMVQRYYGKAFPEAQQQYATVAAPALRIETAR
jgi:integrase